MKKAFGFILIAAFSFVLSYLFNSFFLNLSARSSLDQFLLLFLLICPLIWIFYFLWADPQKIDIQWKFSFSFIKISFLDNLAGVILGFLFFLVYLPWSETLLQNIEWRILSFHLTRNIIGCSENPEDKWNPNEPPYKVHSPKMVTVVHVHNLNLK